MKITKKELEKLIREQVEVESDEELASEALRLFVELDDIMDVWIQNVNNKPG